uniref:Uncharacterized protein n=1 Tax=Methanococcus maripaludis (strain C6 / ATCC BAA-1332) TaxID=444158 RepID=A9A6S5_METM6
MNTAFEIKKYFRRDISYVLFMAFLTFFALSFIFRISYLAMYNTIPYWSELVPQIEVCFGITMAFLILGMIFTEKY